MAIYMSNLWFLCNKDEIMVKLTIFNEGIDELKMIERLKNITVATNCGFT